MLKTSNQQHSASKPDQTSLMQKLNDELQKLANIELNISPPKEKIAWLTKQLENAKPVQINDRIHDVLNSLIKRKWSPDAALFYQLIAKLPHPSAQLLLKISRNWKHANVFFYNEILKNARDNDDFKTAMAVFRQTFTLSITDKVTFILLIDFAGKKRRFELAKTVFDAAVYHRKANVNTFNTYINIANLNPTFPRNFL